MKRIRVYLQYPWVYPDSTYYKSLTTLKPKNIEYINSQNQFKTIENINTVKKSNKIKKFIREMSRKLNLPLVNAHNTKKGDFDLIHCAHCLSLNKNIPWVADIESEWQLWISGKSNILSREIAKKLIKRKNCKKILCWTEKTKREINKTFNDKEIDSKLDLLRFAYPSQKKVNQNFKKVTLLFIGRYFFDKGGDVALEVMDNLTKQYKNVYAKVVCETPKEFKDKYKLNKKIMFFDLMSHKDLFKKIYPKSNIFIYPGFSDSFGFMFIEAMSFGLPIVTVNGYARSEIVKNNENGFIIENKANRKEIIKDLIAKTKILIEDEQKRKKMSKFAHTEVKKGKWSIKNRNKQLLEVYKKSIS